MEIKQLLTFTVLADTLSFTRTAKVLYLSHSTVSKHISALERELGFSLLNRDTRTVRLTYEGTVFLSKIRPALNAILSVHTDIGLPGEMEKPEVLRLGVNSLIELTPSVTSAFMTGIFRLHERHPNLVVDIIPISSVEIRPALKNGTIDCAVDIPEKSYQSPDDEYIQKEIYHDVQVLAFPREANIHYDLANIKELAGLYPTAFISNNSCVYPSAITQFSQLGIQPTIELESSLLRILYRVASERGMTICPRGLFLALNLPELVAIEIPVDVGMNVIQSRENRTPYFKYLVDCFLP